MAYIGHTKVDSSLVQYLRGNFHLERFDPSQRLIEPRIWIYAGFIYSGALNHMMADRDSFSSLETEKSIPIHMGYDSTIISEGEGTVDLKNDYF